MIDWDESSVLVAVFDSRAEADRAAESVVRVGSERNRVVVAQRSDEVVSVKAEMQDEMDESWTSPQAGVAYPKEAAKGLAILMPVCCVVGGVMVGRSVSSTSAASPCGCACWWRRPSAC